ncbi:MAG: CopD family protein [Alphaproteobacteria bacterium]|nr:CopD family protein [Alphaproteobacteria bacterium]
MFFPVLDFLASVFDAVFLIAQAWIIGGVVFAAFLAAPMGESHILRRTLRWVSTGGMILALSVALTTAPPVLALVDHIGLDLRDALGAEFVMWHGVAALSGIAIFLLARSPVAARRPVLLLLPILLLLLAGVMTSHVASRVEGRFVLGVSQMTHVMAASAWVGGIPYLLMAIVESPRARSPGPLTRRFSSIAMVGVALLSVSGAHLAMTHISSFAGLVGGEYGALLLVKIAMFGCMLTLGLGNFLAGRSMEANGPPSVARLRSFAETEVGIAGAVLLVAASLGAQPPPVDILGDLVSPAEMWQRVSPAWPMLIDPPVATDTSWSEVNHNVSGLFVFAVGLLALLHHTGRARWARHWPLIFVLFGWMAIRTDSEAWPLGACSFLGCDGGDPEVIQHRLLTILPAIFGVVEWRVRTGRLHHPAAKYMFPLLCAVGGAMLLTHTHQIGDARQRFLVEFTHLPMGLFGILAGWGRWLELRGDPQVKRWAGWFWPVCLIMVGLILLDYREH